MLQNATSCAKMLGRARACLWQIGLPRGVGGDAHCRFAQAVVAVAQGEDVVVAAAQPRHHQRHVVGLRAAVHEVGDLQEAAKARY